MSVLNALGAIAFAYSYSYILTEITVGLPCRNSLLAFSSTALAVLLCAKYCNLSCETPGQLYQRRQDLHLIACLLLLQDTVATPEVPRMYKANTWSVGVTTLFYGS